MFRSVRGRVIAETAFIVGVAVALGLTRLGAGAVVAVMLATLLLTWLVEAFASGGRWPVARRVRSGRPRLSEAELEPVAETASAESPTAPRPERVRLPLRLSARARPLGVPRLEDTEPQPELQAEPAPEHRLAGSEAVEAEPRVRIGSVSPPQAVADLPVRACRSCGRPIAPERLRAIPDATQCIDCKRSRRPELPDTAFAPVEGPAADVPEPSEVPVSLEPEPAEDPHAAPRPEPEPVLREPAYVREPQPSPVSAPVGARRLPGAQREWNVWELERLVRQHGGGTAGRDEERAFLLVYLREFAGADGVLPSDFDTLVRESFPELIEAAGGR